MKKVGCRYHGSERLIEMGTVAYESDLVFMGHDGVGSSVSGDLIEYEGSTEYGSESMSSDKIVCGAQIGHADAPRQMCGLTIAEWDDGDMSWQLSGVAVLIEVAP